METSVRYIPTQSCEIGQGAEKRTIKTTEKPALCFRGKTYALGIISDDEKIHPVRMTIPEYERSPVVKYGRDEYPVQKYITHLERIMQVKPITTEALRLILEWPNLPEDFEQLAKKNKPVPTTSSPVRAPKKQRQPNCIPTIAKELKTIPQKVRKFLRQQGLSAPYDDEKAIRKLMANFK